MGCNESDLKSQRIIKGEDAEILFNVQYEGGSFFDLTGKTLSAKLKNQDGTILTLSGAAVVTLSPATNGKGKLILTDIQTGLLKSGEAMGFDLHIVNGSDLKIVPFRRVLQIVDQI